MREEIEYRAGIVRVVVGADQATRFVHRKGHRLVAGRTDALAIDGNFVDSRRHFLADFGNFAVHANVFGLDQRFRGPAGADPGVGDKFLETNFGSFQSPGSWLDLSRGRKD